MQEHKGRGERVWSRKYASARNDFTAAHLEHNIPVFLLLFSSLHGMERYSARCLNFFVVLRQLMFPSLSSLTRSLNPLVPNNYPQPSTTSNILRTCTHNNNNHRIFKERSACMYILDIVCIIYNSLYRGASPHM